MRDLRYTLRTLRRSPSFTYAAIMTLALGTAVNAIAFTLLNSLALRPMPVRKPGRWLIADLRLSIADLSSVGWRLRLRTAD